MSSKITAERICMLCPERVRASAETSEDAWRLLDAKATGLGWHEHKRVDRHSADVCPDCVVTLRASLNMSQDGEKR